MNEATSSSSSRQSRKAKDDEEMRASRVRLVATAEWALAARLCGEANKENFIPGGDWWSSLEAERNKAANSARAEFCATALQEAARCPPQRRAPQRRAPQRRAPQRRAPQRRAPQRRTPQRRTLQHGTPQHGTPQHGTPQSRTPESRTPQLRTPQSRTPQSRTPQHTTPQRFVPISPGPVQEKQTWLPTDLPTPVQPVAVVRISLRVPRHRGEKFVLFEGRVSEWHRVQALLAKALRLPFLDNYTTAILSPITRRKELNDVMTKLHPRNWRHFNAEAFWLFFKDPFGPWLVQGRRPGDVFELWNEKQANAFEILLRTSALEDCLEPDEPGKADVLRIVARILEVYDSYKRTPFYQEGLRVELLRFEADVLNIRVKLH